MQGVTDAHRCRGVQGGQGSSQRRTGPARSLFAPVLCLQGSRWGPTFALGAGALRAEEEVERPGPERVRGGQRRACVVGERDALRPQRDRHARAGAEVEAGAGRRGALAAAADDQLLAAAWEAQPQRAGLAWSRGMCARCACVRGCSGSGARAANPVGARHACTERGPCRWPHRVQARLHGAGPMRWAHRPPASAAAPAMHARGRVASVQAARPR